MSSSDTSKILAWAQVLLTFALISGLFWLLSLIIMGYSTHLNADEQKIISQSLRFIEDGTMIALGFWFQRQRGGGIPDQVTHESTSPDGTKTSVKYPASMSNPPIPTPPGSQPGAH